MEQKIPMPRNQVMGVVAFLSRLFTQDSFGPLAVRKRGQAELPQAMGFLPRVVLSVCESTSRGKRFSMWRLFQEPFFLSTLLRSGQACLRFLSSNDHQGTRKTAALTRFIFFLLW
jgi:hypothetical protein